MADSTSNSGYQPQGSGPHPTMAGNVLDPGVKADGHMSGGSGVGGASERAIRQEGAEHMGMTGSNSGGGVTDRLERATGMGSGVGSGTGMGSETRTGLTGSEHPHGTEGSSTTGGYLSTVKQYLGMGGPHEGESTGVHDSTLTGTGDGARDTNLTGNDRSGLGTDTTGRGSGISSGAAGMSDNYSSTAGSGRDPGMNTSGRSAQPADSDVTTGRDPTISADPHTEDTAQGQGAGSRRETEGEDSAGHEGKHHGSDKPPSKRENPDAIPTAGGEKLGAKHWGESKIVPDNPPRRESEGGAGVSSAAGQGDKATRDNTVKNTGAGTHEKESMAGKVMGQLHLGGHNK